MRKVSTGARARAGGFVKEPKERHPARRIALVGASGSIGRQTLDVCAAHPHELDVVLLSVHRDVEFLKAACARFSPAAVCITDVNAPAFDPPAGVACFRGPDELEAAFAEVPFDLLVNAVVGAAGLHPSYLALRLGRPVATANKESLVIAGALLRETAREHGTRLLPIDSEHSAIWQCLRAGSLSEVESIWLTASGGPFLRRPLETFESVTPAEALGHPTWSMGPKISVDSATMMNKGFEIIEARWLFDLDPDRIHVVVHPQSIVHSAVAFQDGSVIAQMGAPDMRHPIAYALLQPERPHSKIARLKLDQLGTLHFEPPEATRFPALELARQALRQGDTACVALNAANEEAVASFLAGRSSFSAITQCVAAQLDKFQGKPLGELRHIYEVDHAVRESARQWLTESGQGKVSTRGRRN